MLATQRKTQELDGAVGLEKFAGRNAISSVSFCYVPFDFTHRYVEHAKYLDKKQEMEVKVALSAQFPEEPFLSL